MMVIGWCLKMFHFETKNENGRLYYSYIYTCDKCGEEITDKQLVDIEISQYQQEKIKKYYHKECANLEELLCLLV
jgi:hypothetical protein